MEKRTSIVAGSPADGEKLAWKRVMGSRVDARVVPSLSSTTGLSSLRWRGSSAPSNRACTVPRSSAVVDPIRSPPTRASTVPPGANPVADRPTREPCR